MPVSASPVPSGPGCPCGSDAGLAGCCGRLLSGAALAVTAEELMRSRYTANAVGDVDHLFRTWHPRTRPADLRLDPAVRWTGLRILDRLAGEADDDTGEVEFSATWEVSGPGGRTRERGQLHERSRFARRAGRWMYVDGDVS